VIIYKGINIMKKEWLEGLISETISQIKQSLDRIYLKDMGDMKRIDNVKATFFIVKRELDNIFHTLKDNNPETINKRHTDVINIMKEFQKRIEDEQCNVLCAKATNNRRVIKFIRQCCTFLEIVHTAFHCDTPKERRKEIVEQYTGDTNG
jgi:hypothetical protein|tara:strand:- start:688 stop:1137 length:450 start_codon:yes stop_codon:yes gene_type:complete